MRPITLQFIRDVCRGELLSGGGDIVVERVCTDSRQAGPGDLFIAVEGEHFDAHAFINDVAAKKAAAILISNTKVPGILPKCGVVTVGNTRQALGELAAAYRREFRLPVIAVGGSNGKTTAKELIASLLRQRFNTHFSPASFNNDIGVPLTLLGLEHTHGAAVVEVGTNHPGELEPLVRMIQPGYGVITSIGREHLEFFGDLTGVAHEEGVLAELLPADGKLFINGDTEQVGNVVSRSKASVVKVGFGPFNAWRALNIRIAENGMSFEVSAPVPGFCGQYQLPLLGRHQVVNALLAMAVAVELGLTRDEVQAGLATCRPAKMRLQLSTIRDVRVLDDAYNANADSMRAALETLHELPCRGRRVAVLGDMAELGAHGEAAHEEVGRSAAELGVRQLFAVGKMAPVMGRAARAAGLDQVMEFNDVELAGRAVRSYLQPGDVVLLKASRATRMERIGDLLRSNEDVK
ncbi:MAG: UDP-N-acetylmuramoyl-tripeptide--D-alanyl-D-alanine ligase [Pedosphaera sp.]|nr:UDP-N-acetylmuramoyl-tripeptide--D-alanyl-D-alanine ligase [Pedosphaera sp.]